MQTSINTNSFNEFWPEYLRAHGSRLSRAFHFAGIALSAAVTAALLACGMVFFLPLAVVPAFVGARVGHKLSPRKDRISEEHPEWAVRADLKMFGLFVTGRLGKALREAGVGTGRRAFSVG